MRAVVNSRHRTLGGAQSTTSGVTWKTVWLSHLTRVVFLVLVGLLAFTGVANAQEEDGATGPFGETGDRAFAECRSRGEDVRVVGKLLDDKVVEYPEDEKNVLNPTDNKEWIEKVKKEHPEEFKRAAQELEDNQSLLDKANDRVGRFVCGALNPLQTGVKKAQESEFWKDPVGKFVKSVIEGNEQALQTMFTLWMNVSFDQGFMAGSAEGVRNIVWYIALAGFVINLIILGARMAWSRRNGLADGLEETGSMFWNLALYGVVVPGGIFAAISATDTLSTNIMENFGATDSQAFLENTGIDQSVAGPILVLILAGISFIGACTQILALAARTLLLPILVGFMPLFAGLTATDFGKSALNASKHWLISLVIFKPLAAIVYVVAFWIADQPGEGLMWTVMRVLVVAIAGFSIIGVAKIIVPAVASMGGANSGAVGGVAAAATGAVVGGAMALSGGVAGAAGKGLGKMAGQSATGAASGGSAGGGNGPGGGGGLGASGSGGAPTGGGGGGGGSAEAAGASGAGSGSGSHAGAGGAEAATASGAGSGSGSHAGAEAATASGAGGAEAATAAGAGTGGRPGQPSEHAGSGPGGGAGLGASGAESGKRGPVRKAVGVAASSAAVTAAGAKVAARAARNAGRSGGHYLPVLQGISDDALGSAGHPGQISR